MNKKFITLGMSMMLSLSGAFAQQNSSAMEKANDEIINVCKAENGVFISFKDDKCDYAGCAYIGDNNKIGYSGNNERAVGCSSSDLGKYRIKAKDKFKADINKKIAEEDAAAKKRKDDLEKQRKAANGIGADRVSKPGDNDNDDGDDSGSGSGGKSGGANGGNSGGYANGGNSGGGPNGNNGGYQGGNSGGGPNGNNGGNSAGGNNGNVQVGGGDDDSELNDKNCLVLKKGKKLYKGDTCYNACKEIKTGIGAVLTFGLLGKSKVGAERKSCVECLYANNRNDLTDAAIKDYEKKYGPISSNTGKGKGKGVDLSGIATTTTIICKDKNGNVISINGEICNETHPLLVSGNGRNWSPGNGSGNGSFNGNGNGRGNNGNGVGNGGNNVSGGRVVYSGNGNGNSGPGAGNGNGNNGGTTVVISGSTGGAGGGNNNGNSGGIGGGGSVGANIKLPAFCGEDYNAKKCNDWLTIGPGKFYCSNGADLNVCTGGAAGEIRAQGRGQYCADCQVNQGGGVGGNITVNASSRPKDSLGAQIAMVVGAAAPIAATGLSAYFGYKSTQAVANASVAGLEQCRLASESYLSYNASNELSAVTPEEYAKVNTCNGYNLSSYSGLSSSGLGGLYGAGYTPGYIGGYNGQYGGYNPYGSGIGLGGIVGSAVGGISGGYSAGISGGYSGGYLQGGYTGGYAGISGGYSGGYLQGGYNGGYLQGGYSGGYLQGGVNGISIAGGVNSGYQGGYSGGYSGGYTGGYYGGTGINTGINAGWGSGTIPYGANGGYYGNAGYGYGTGAGLGYGYGSSGYGTQGSMQASNMDSQYQRAGLQYQMGSMSSGLGSAGYYPSNLGYGAAGGLNLGFQLGM
jgi:hypothetical protein